MPFVPRAVLSQSKALLGVGELPGSKRLVLMGQKSGRLGLAKLLRERLDVLIRTAVHPLLL